MTEYPNTTDDAWKWFWDIGGKAMNTKTYCPLGKCDCKNYGDIAYYSPLKEIRCFADGGLRLKLMSPDYEVCPIPSNQQKIERYDMCEDQPAQIECWKNNCVWQDEIQYRICKNISPAIELHVGAIPDYWICRSFKQK